MPRSPTSSPIFEFPTEIITSLVIPKIITHSETNSQSQSTKINLKSPLTTKSKSRTGIPIIIETNCDTGRYSKVESTTQSSTKPAGVGLSSRSPSLEESDRSYFEVGAELEDEDYLVDEYSHPGHKLALSFKETVVYSKSLSTPHSPGSSITSQPPSAEQCLMQKGFRVEVREYVEKSEGSEERDEGEPDQGCCGCMGWLTTFWRRGT
ncbi:hypothetical protein TWF506_004071 [Arthrobotrys conoides]|uniref:Uncharacterized protein n=1 Tax=Arthrobotrys conoides TaxID=74498 RepID=A0AAN8N1F6_9PEZI